MFCDLVGSTSLAAKLDAEDWRDLVGAYLDEASKAVAEFGGHVLKKLGDGLMALFGYPRAQENDAERAARAGARDSARARSPQRAKCRQRPARARRSHRPRERPGRGRPDGRGVRRRAQRFRAGAGGRRTGNAACHRGRAASGRRPVRRRGQGAARAERRARQADALSLGARERRRAAGFSAQPDPVSRARGRTGAARAALRARAGG